MRREVDRRGSAVAKAVNQGQIAHELGSIRVVLLRWKAVGRSQTTVLDSFVEVDAAVKRIGDLISADPVFSKDSAMTALAGYYGTLLFHARSSVSIAKEVESFLSEDENVFKQQFDDGDEYCRRLKELTYRRRQGEIILS